MTSTASAKPKLHSAHDLSLRCLAQDEMGLLADWAGAEGWNPGKRDGECFYAADPAGFMVGERFGEPISTISVVTYPENFAFLGFYIVKKEFRGRGYGLKTWRAGMRRLAGYNVGLDGVTSQQSNYAKSGFTLAWRNIRFGGKVKATPLEKDIAKAVVPLASIPFPSITAYDRRHFPAPRPTFLYLWMSRPGTTALAYMHKGRIAGYGVIRPCQTGFKIGPLFADDDKIADALFRALAERATGAQLFIDPPEPNLSATRLAERHGMKPVFETARMYTGPAPSVGLRGVYGLTSFELG